MGWKCSLRAVGDTVRVSQVLSPFLQELDPWRHLQEGAAGGADFVFHASGRWGHTISARPTVSIKISQNVADVWFVLDDKHRRACARSRDSQGRLLVVHLNHAHSKLLGDGTGVREQSETSGYRSVE